MQPCVGWPAPQGTGEQHRDKCWAARPPAASPWMLCSGWGQGRQPVDLGPWQPPQEPGKGAGGCCGAQWLGELVMWGWDCSSSLFAASPGEQGHVGRAGDARPGKLCRGCASTPGALTGLNGPDQLHWGPPTHSFCLHSGTPIAAQSRAPSPALSCAVGPRPGVKGGLVCHAAWTTTYVPGSSLHPHQPPSSDASPGPSSTAPPSCVGAGGAGRKGARSALGYGVPAAGGSVVCKGRAAWFARGAHGQCRAGGLLY